jgi:hypothetical protein
MFHFLVLVACKAGNEYQKTMNLAGAPRDYPTLQTSLAGADYGSRIKFIDQITGCLDAKRGCEGTFLATSTGGRRLDYRITSGR